MRQCKFNVKSCIEQICSNKELTIAEVDTLDRWLRDRSNREAIDSYLTVAWRESISDIESGSDNQLELKLTYENLTSEIERRKISLSGGDRWRSLQIKFQRVASIALIPLMLISTWFIYSNSKDRGEWVQVNINRGDRTQFTLPDSTVVWLNSDTKLSFSSKFNDKNRALKLDGEGFFIVAPNRDLPLTVEVDDIKVEAIGTEFNIRGFNDEDKITTYLAEGVVDILNNRCPKRGAERMESGDIGIYSKSSRRLEIDKGSLFRTDGWREGRLQFYKDPLNIVFKKLERWYDVDIITDNESFKDETFTVDLKPEESLTTCLKIMDSALGIKYSVNKKIVTIMKRYQ